VGRKVRTAYAVVPDDEACSATSSSGRHGATAGRRHRWASGGPGRGEKKEGKERKPARTTILRDRPGFLLGLLDLRSSSAFRVGSTKPATIGPAMPNRGPVGVAKSGPIHEERTARPAWPGGPGRDAFRSKTALEGEVKRALQPLLFAPGPRDMPEPISSISKGGGYRSRLRSARFHHGP